MIKIRDVPNLTLGKADSGSRSNVAIGIEASATTDFELAISRINEEPKYQLVINNEGVTSNAANYGGIAFTQGAAATTVMASIKVDYTTTDGYPNLVFGTRSTSDALTILDDGSVSTNGRLDVNHDTVKLHNSANTNNTYFFAENTGAGNAGIKLKNSQGEFTIIANDRLRFISDDSPSVEVMSLHPDGNVGIGTGASTPLEKLTVNQGNLELKCVGGGTSKIIFSEATLGDESFYIEHDGALTGAANLLNIFGDGAGGAAGGITLTRDGKVGIGTGSSVDYKLHVKSADGSYGIVNENASGVKVGLYTGGSSASIGTATNHKLELLANGGPKVSVGTDGKVGIGTGSNAPLDKLNVWGDQISVSQNIVSSSTYDWLALRSNRTIDDYGGLNAEYAKLYFKSITGSHYSGSLHFSIKQEINSSAAMTDVMSLWHNGKVGIGTGSGGPQAKFHVEGGRIKIRQSSSFSGFDIAHESGGYTYLINHDNTYMGFYVGGSAAANEIMRLADGKVGINLINTNPTEELEVDGTVKATLFKGQFQGGGGAGGGGRAIFNAQDNIENGNLEIFTNGNTENGGDAVTFVTDNNTSSPYGKVARVDSLYEKQAVDFIPVQPGVALEGEIWYSIPSNDNGAQGSIFFGISRYDKDKKLISGNIGLNYFASQTQVKDSNWHKVSGNITLPTSHTPYNGSDGGPVRYIKPYVIVNYSGGTQAVSFGGMYIARRKAITIGATQTLGSETPGQLIAETNSFTRSSDFLTFNGKISQHLHEQQTGAGKCNCWTLKDIDPLITYDSNNNPTSGFNITPETSNHDVTIIGSENQTPVLKINKEGLIVGFGVRNTVGTGSAGGVTAAKLVTSGELYTNAAFNSREQDNITPVNGKITLNLFLKDSAFASADHNHNASYGGSLAVGSGANANKIGLLAADGTTTLGSYITVPYATTAGSANGGAADTLSTIDSEVDADHYLTFVNSNNSSATYESFYTDGGIKYNPNKNKLTVDKIKCDTNLATAANTTTTALKHIIGKVNGGTVHYDFTDGQVQTFLGLKSAAYETKGTFALATQVLTNVPANALFTDTTYNTATSSALGLVKIGYTENGKNYPVELSSGKMYVNVPWVDTNTDTNYYLNGISKSNNTLTFSVNGATNQTYTFGANAFTDTTIPTNNNQLANGAGYTTYTANQTVNTTSNVTFNKMSTALLSNTDAGVTAFHITPYKTGVNMTAAQKANPSFSRDKGKNWNMVSGSDDPYGTEQRATQTIIYGSSIGESTEFFHEAYIGRQWRTSRETQLSDKRIKTDIKNLSLGLDFVKKLRPVEYKMTTEATPRRNFGIIAQELEATLEEEGEADTSFINVPKYHELSEEEKEASLKFLDYSQINVCLLKAVQELAAKVEALEAKLEEN